MKIMLIFNELFIFPADLLAESFIVNFFNMDDNKIHWRLP